MYDLSMYDVLVGLQLQKESLTQVFFCEYCEILKNSFFIEYLRWLLLSF